MTNQNKHLQLVTDICNYISQATDEPTLKELAQRANLSPYHFQKIFKNIIGVSPKSYSMANKKDKVRKLLIEKDVTKAIYHSGHESSSRFYEKSNSILGMTPTQYKKGGEKQTIMVAVGQCSLGAVLVAQSSKGICGILLGDDPELLIEDIQARFHKADIIAGDILFETTIAKVIGFIDNPSIKIDLPLDIQGTAFQQKVWQALLKIPFGETVSYSQIAQMIEKPKSFRAVANACGSNNIAVAIPCHRVVQKNGNLAGYRWGIERKVSLLNKEKKM